ncbi:MAG: aminoacyl-histidine dipeptidase [Paludibacteraceae bacterium]|nr:aminoacyl-histidine dipeptidase [Paludibacteraceae bacterium]
MNILHTIEPLNCWTYFEEITKIPRASKKEEKIRKYLIDFAQKEKLEYVIDGAGNVIIKKPATANQENKPAVILQSHMDMVCEKNSDSTHNFDSDSIDIYIDSDWVKAKDTTLGADNGIGIAMQMAVLSAKNLEHPALECLFTVDEETGLYGASNLDSTVLTGKTLINLDSEEEGEFCIGCAGGMDTLAELTFEKEETPADYFFFTVKISGLQGGHSGEDINKGRANAIKILSRYISILKSKTDLRITRINGGNLRNAIAREAQAVLAVPFQDKELVRVEVNNYIHEVETEYAKTENQLTIDLDSSETQAFVFPKTISDRLVRALLDCPHGVIEMNESISTLVETSTNLAAIKTTDKGVFIETSQRSASELKKKEISTIVGHTFASIGARVTFGKNYPGWEPNFDSSILKKSESIYTAVFHQKPIVKVIHAGLECGVIAQKYPSLDMISFGPTILGAHSPSEKISISSVQKCWALLTAILKEA